jgi:hypothetical protein
VRGSERGGQVPEKKLQHLLQAILRDDLAVEPPYYITSVRTFEEAGVPSEDRGLVVTMADGSEYQITIVRSQWISGRAHKDLRGLLLRRSRPFVLERVGHC